MASPPGDIKPEDIKQRRESMRGELIEHMRAHHRRRLSRRHFASSAVLLLAIILLPVFLSPRITSRPIEITNRAIEPPLARPSFEFIVVSTRKAITDEYIITPTTHVQWIDDRTLLENLIALNRPAGLVRQGERTWLTTPVADEDHP